MTKEELKALREANELTQHMLAERLNYTASHIAHLEQGKAGIPERFAQMVRLVLAGQKEAFSHTR